MLRSALLSASSISRLTSTRLLNASAVRYTQASTTPDTKELEDLFLNTNASKNENTEQSNNFNVRTQERDGRRRAAGNINRVELLGGVAADPSFLVSRKGDDYATFRLFTNISVRKRDGTFSEQVEVHDVTAFVPQLVNFLKSSVKRGTKLYVIGNLHHMMRADGSRKTMVKAEMIQSIAKPGAGQSNKHAETEGA